MSPFVFAIVQPASAAWAKADVARLHGEALRGAYARPGLLTWKGALPAAGLGTPFARVSGRGIGPLATAAEIASAARELGAPRLHVFARDARGRDEPAAEDLARAEALEAEIRAAGTFEPGARAEPGELVLDVVVAAGETPYVGVHTHGPLAIPYPGGRFPVEVPPEAPSRAYRKLEEMLAWSGLPVRSGDVAVELGAAPGGAALALVRRGVSVLAIDPAPIDAAVLAHEGPGGARVQALRLAAGAVRPEHLPSEARWLLVDVNLAPPVALRYLERVASRLPRLAGIVATLKLNDAAVVAGLPDLLDRLSARGREVSAIQLASHRREIGAIARAR